MGAIGVVGGGKNPGQLGTLHWYDANKSFGAFAVGTNPREMAFDGSSVWVANFTSNNVMRLDIKTGAVTATTPVGTGPLGLAFDGTNIWVSNFTSNSVTKVNAATGVASPPITVGTHPWGVAFDGTNIWVADNGNANVKRINPTTGAVNGTFGVGTAPRDLIYDGTNIWVANRGSANVSRTTERTSGWPTPGARTSRVSTLPPAQSAADRSRSEPCRTRCCTTGRTSG